MTVKYLTNEIYKKMVGLKDVDDKQIYERSVIDILGEYYDARIPKDSLETCRLQLFCIICQAYEKKFKTEYSKEFEKFLFNFLQAHIG